MILSCSNCNKDLVDIVISVPNEPIETKVEARCAFCDSKSFTKLIKGKFRFSPIIGKSPTIVEDISYSDTKPPIWTFHTKKA